MVLDYKIFPRILVKSFLCCVVKQRFTNICLLIGSHLQKFIVFYALMVLVLFDLKQVPLIFQGIQRFGASKEAVKDVHTILKDLEDECIPDRFISSMPTLLPPHLHILPEGNLEFDDGAGFSPQRVSDCNEGLDDRNHGNSSVDDQRGVSDTAVDGNVPIDWIKEEIYQNSDIKPDEELGAWQPTSYQGGGWDDIDTVPGLRSLDNVSSDATGFKCYDTSKNSKNEEVVMVETTGMFGSMCLFQVF